MGWTKPGSEGELHEMVCDYLRYSYPEALFHSDFGSGLKMTYPQAVRQRKIQKMRAWPDILIPEPRGGYHGLFLELKREGEKVTLKDGVTPVASEHIREQTEVLGMLSERGYRATFSIGFDQSRGIIDEYLNLGT